MYLIVLCCVCLDFVSGGIEEKKGRMVTVICFWLNMFEREVKRSTCFIDYFIQSRLCWRVIQSDVRPHECTTLSMPRVYL